MASCTSLVWDKSKSENASSSPAKKQSCEDFPPPPPSLSEKTDPRSIIKVYNYDSDDEINYEDVDEFGGFDVMDFPKSFACGKIMPIINLNYHANHLKSLSELALKEYNEKEKTKLEFVKLVKANLEPCEGFQYYITFDVKDADAVDGPILTFQALVWDGIDEIEVVLCRLEISN
ncbi:hypothetical protein CsSME_00014796 [Camellia sinensis var. sinensis]